MNKRQKKTLVPELRFPEFRGSGDWDEKPFSKLFTVGNGRDHKHLPDGDIPVYGSGGYMRSVNNYLYDGESVCIGRKGTIDKPVFLTGKFWTVDTLFYTHSFKSCLPRFVYTLFQNIEWKKHNEAGGVPSLSKTNIEKIAVLVPKKIEEQQKIADCLSSLDELITAQTQKHQALQSYKKGLMQNLFPNEGETVPALRFPEFRDKGDWVDEKFGDITNFNSGGTPSKDRAEYWDGDIPWISAASMHNISIEDSDRYITKLAVEDGARLASKGTLLLLVRGSMLHKRIPVGIAECEVAFNQDVKALRLKKPVLERFLLYFLISSELRLLGVVTKTGIGAGKLDTNDLKDFKVSIPKNTDEQQKIAECLLSVDDLITAQAQKIEELKAHKKGLMQQIFPNLDDCVDAKAGEQSK